MTVIVYSKPDCQGCTAVKRWLDMRGISYTARDVTENADDMATVQRLGYRRMPVVVWDDGHFSGFDPNELAKVADGSDQPQDGHD